MRIGLGLPTPSGLRSLGVLGDRIVSARTQGLTAPAPLTDLSRRIIGTTFDNRMATLRSALRNISIGTDLVLSADAVLEKVGGLLQEARDVVGEAAAGGLTAEHLARSNTRLTEIRAEINDLAETFLRGRRVFGQQGIGVGRVFRDSFDDDSRIASFTRTYLSSGRVGLDFVQRALFGESLANPLKLDLNRTTAVPDNGRYVSPQTMQAAVVDTFDSLERVAANLTSALVDTNAGAVRLGRTFNTRRADLFDNASGTNLSATTALVGGGYVMQRVNTEALFGDDFTSMANVDADLTTAAVHTVAGNVTLPTDWYSGMTRSDHWSLGRVLTVRRTDTFTDTTGTDPASTAVVLTQSGGSVTAPTVPSTTLWSESPELSLDRRTTPPFHYISPKVHTFTTRTFDYNVKNITLSANATIPTNTAIDYHIRTNGPGADWQQITPGVNTAILVPGTELTLRATLSTSSGGRTPTLHSYTVATENLKTRGVQWVSTPVSLGYDTTALKLTVAQMLPAGTSIAYEVSANNGVDWMPITPGAITELGALSGSTVRVRATFGATDPYVAASLEDMTLETYDYEESKSFTSSFQALSEGTWALRLTSALSSLPAGTGITYYATHDGGSSWQEILPGGSTDFGVGNPGTQIGLRAVLTSTGTFTPSLTGFTLDRIGYSTDKYLYTKVNTAGQDVTNLTLQASDSKPSGTAVAYEVSTDGGGVWNPISPGAMLVVPPGSDILMRAFLTTNSIGVAPSIADYQLTTNRPEAGSQWVSTPIETGSDVNTVRLNVSEHRPAGTQITYQLSTDGGNTYQTITPGALVSIAPTSQILLRALFESTHPAAEVARLFDYELETEDYVPSQVLTSTSTDLGHDVSEARLDVGQTLPTGTNIAYQLSNDAGQTWVAATPGEITSFATPGSRLAMRATLNGTNIATPELLDYTLTAPMFTTGYVYSTLLTFPEAVDNLTLTSDFLVNTGTDMLFHFSPDNGATWTSLTPGVQALLANPIDQAVLRATLTSTDGRRTAELRDWNLSARSFASDGSFSSTVMTLSRPVESLRLIANAVLNGGSIRYEVSNDAGGTWVEAAPGGQAGFPSPGAQVRLRATLQRPDGSAPPELLGYALRGDNQDALIPSSFRIMVGVGEPNLITMRLPVITGDALGLEEMDISTVDTAEGALRTIESALETIGLGREELTNRLQQLDMSLRLQEGILAIGEDVVGRIRDEQAARESISRLRSEIMYGVQVMPAELDRRRQTISLLLALLPSQASTLALKPKEAGQTNRFALGQSTGLKADPFAKLALPPLLAPPGPLPTSGQGAPRPLTALESIFVR